MIFPYESTRAVQPRGTHVDAVSSPIAAGPGTSSPGDIPSRILPGGPFPAAPIGSGLRTRASFPNFGFGCVAVTRTIAFTRSIGSRRVNPYSRRCAS